MKKHSPFFKKILSDKLQCTLCPHECIIPEGKTGWCRTRVNHSQGLEMTTYGRLAAVAIDPIEKKPLNHFRPGTKTFSVGQQGCNLTCPFCQNAGLSQCLLGDTHEVPTKVRQWTPEEVVQKALASGCKSIAFTYSEPILSLEFALDIAPLAKQASLDLVFVTNGQMNEAPAKILGNAIDAANIDLKSFSEKTYKHVLGGNLQSTLNTIEQLAKAGVWVEVTTLIVPNMNDSASELKEIATFLANLSLDIPWHISRFHPSFHRMDTQPTPTSVMEMALEIGSNAGLRYVYLGNMRSGKGENTYCSNCQDVVVDRRGYEILQINTSASCCIRCGHKLAGVGFP